MPRLLQWIAAAFASAAIGAYVGRDNLWVALLIAAVIAILGWAVGTVWVQERIPILQTGESRLLSTYLAGRELYTMLKTEMREGEPVWDEWQPMLYSYEDLVYDTLHSAARLRADAINRRMQMVLDTPHANWAVVSRGRLNERLEELAKLLGETPVG